MFTFVPSLRPSRSFWRLFFLVAVMAGSVAGLHAADAKPKAKSMYAPRHDPADIPFRNAPMSAAVRSVVVPLSADTHVAFDTELLRTHAAWEGKTLNLWGAVYHGAKDKFYCDYDGATLWENPPVYPWSIKAYDAKALKYEDAMPRGRYLGVSTKTGATTFMYELDTPEQEIIRVHETPRHNPAMGSGVIERRLEISRTKRSLTYLAHIVRSPRLTAGVPAGLMVFDRGTNVLLVAVRADCTLKLELEEVDAAYPLTVWKENKNDSFRAVDTAVGKETQVQVRIPLHKDPVVVEILSLVAPTLPAALEKLKALPKTTLQPADLSFPDSKQAAPVASAVHTVPSAKGFVLPAGDAAYRLEAFPLPPEIELLVTGMDFMPNGDLAVCTWLGDVYIVEQAQGKPAGAVYRRFARGLNEPGGLKVINGLIYIVQKQELTRLIDTDGNGEADRFECLNHDWGYTGNYHDFTFGPALDSAGNIFIMRNGNRGLYDVPYMGWCLRFTADGKALTPFCDGLRSPNGFGTYQGDIFMTENQGNWVPACKLTHMQGGKFYGFPSTRPAPKDQYENPKEFAPPAVWFPYSLAKSTSGMATVPEGFGPFTGQLMVGDFQNAIVMRVDIEKVNGEWQGAVFPFAKGFSSGVNRLVFGPDGKLYVGGCKNKAWAAVAPKEYSLDRVSFTGKTPFEVKDVHVLKDGFELSFTQPVDAETGALADSYDMVQFGFQYHQTYGSPEVDYDGNVNSSSGVKITKAVLSADRLKVRLTVADWKTGYVTMVRCLDVVNEEGKKLRHDTFWYTLNQLPK